MSNIQQILASILNAIYGKDVRQAIHDGVEMAYNKADDAETSAAAAAEAASGSQNSAAASAQAAANSASSASDSANQAEQYKNEAFHTTPAGYEDFVSEVNSSLDYLYNNGVKNLLPLNQSSTEVNGITWTINSDGTVTANGTASTTSKFVVTRDVPFPAGSYKGSAAPSDASTSTFYAKFSTSSEGLNDVGRGVSFSPSSSTTVTVELRVVSGQTVSNVIFKPMVTLATTPNSDYAHYVPYAQTNVALTEKVKVINHNIPRLVPKDITSYVTDGTLWQRLNGTNGFDLFEDIYCGDYIHMSRAISAYEQTQTYQATGSDYVTIAEIDGKMGNGDSSQVTYHHLVMVAGKGFGGTQHFGRSRMNPTDTTVGGYVGSEMFTTTIGAVVSSGSTASQATINQQLYAEFGSHLKTIRQMLSNSINATGYNRFGTNSGCSNNWEWTSVQAFLMDEIEVYGSVVWGSSGYDVGNGNHQFALFRHSKEAMNNRTANYWLKDVAAAARFARINDNGIADSNLASRADIYVRPCFVIA